MRTPGFEPAASEFIVESLTMEFDWFEPSAIFTPLS